MKTEVHAPGFHIFALQILFHARCRAAVPNHEKGLYRQTENRGLCPRFCFYILLPLNFCAAAAQPLSIMHAAALTASSQALNTPFSVLLSIFHHTTFREFLHTVSCSLNLLYYSKRSDPVRHRPFLILRLLFL